MKKAILLIASIFIFTACSSMGGKSNIISILSAPKLTQTENEIVKAIDTYLGENITLKYPKSSAYTAPVQVYDIDGDGEKEAIVLYYASNKGANIRLAILEHQEGKWNLTFDIEGLGTEVFRFETASLVNKDTKQILIGYSYPNTSDRFIAAYFIENGIKSDVYSERCYDFATSDIDYDGKDEIILVGDSGVNERTRVQILRADDKFSLKTVNSIYLVNNDATVTNIAISPLSGKDGSGVFIDYVDSYKNTYTEAYVFTGNYVQNLLPVRSIQKSWDYSYPLKSQDITGDRTVEIPTILEDDTHMPSKFKYMEWTDYSVTSSNRNRFGICDITNGIFVGLPNEWQGYISLESEENSPIWKILNSKNDRVLLVVEKLAPGEIPSQSDMKSAYITFGAQRWRFEFGDDLSPDQKEYILSTISYIK